MSNKHQGFATFDDVLASQEQMQAQQLANSGKIVVINNNNTNINIHP